MSSMGLRIPLLLRRLPPPCQIIYFQPTVHNPHTAHSTTMRHPSDSYRCWHPVFRQQQVQPQRYGRRVRPKTKHMAFVAIGTRYWFNRHHPHHLHIFGSTPVLLLFGLPSGSLPPTWQNLAWSPCLPNQALSRRPAALWASHTTHQPIKLIKPRSCHLSEPPMATPWSLHVPQGLPFLSCPPLAIPDFPLVQ